MLLYRRPWTRQPQGPVKVVGIRPALAWLGSQPTIDHQVSNRWTFDPASNTINSRVYGRSVVSNAPSFPIERVGASTAAEQAVTFVVVMHMGAGATDHQLIRTSNSGAGGGFSLYGQFGGGTGLTLAKSGVADIAVVTITANTSYVVVASHRTDTGEGYLLARPIHGGPILYATGNSVAAALAGNGSFHVAGSSGGGVIWSGDVGMAVASFDFLPEPAGRALLNNPWQLFTPLPRGLMWAPGATVQLLRPASDISAGAWTPSTGATLFGVLDEVTADDADFITTSSASTSEVAFGTGLDPLSSTGHTIRYRAKGTGTLTVTLRQGATLIATHVPTLTAAFQTFSFTLSAAEADAITSYSALSLRFVSS